MKKKYDQFMLLIYDTGRNQKVVKSRFWLTKNRAFKFFEIIKKDWESSSFYSIRMKLKGGALCVLYGLYGGTWHELKYTIPRTKEENQKENLILINLMGKCFKNI